MVPEIFCLTDSQWETVYQTACRQTVAGLVFKGFDHLPEMLLPPDALLARWLVKTNRIEADGRRMDQVVCRLFSHLKEIGTEAVLQKGQGIASLYREPFLRECGDIDIFVMSGPGNVMDGLEDCVRNKMPDGGWEYSLDGVVVEQHSRLLDVSNPFKRRYLRYLVGTYGFCCMVMTEPRIKRQVEIKIPAPYLNIILLNSHILKHQMGTGIGLRQLCDLAVAYKAYEAEIDRVQLSRIYRKLGLYRWSLLLDAFLAEFILPDKEDLPADLILEYRKDGDFRRGGDVRKFLDKVMENGNFGFQNASSRKYGKLSTAMSFLRNAGFACRYAFPEYFWTIIGLSAGQFVK